MALLFIRMLTALPLGMRRAIGRIGGLIFSFVPTRERRIARLQLIKLGRSNRPNPILRAMYSNLGQTALEALDLTPILTHKEETISCPDLPFVISLVANGRPILVLAAHTGNWDLMAAFFIRHGFDISTIAKMAKNPMLQQVLVTIRDRYGINTIWRNSVSETRKIARVFARNGMLAALIDQDLDAKSCFSPFFGKLAKTSTSLIDIAKHYDAEIVSAFNIRTKRNRYIIEVKPFSADLDEQGIVDEFNLRLQTLIERYPAQWVWFHKRWRSLPTGVTMSSSEYIDYLEKLEL